MADTRGHARTSTAATVVADSPTTSTFTKVAGLSPTTSSEGIPPVIPTAEERKFDGRTLVLCFDGTGDQFDQDNSNVIQFFSLLKKDDKSKQLVYYQAGIGTYTVPDIATPFWSSLSKTLDEMFAWNLDAHVMGGYEFLMQNYNVNDRICIFGFSRGAYTARSLAGMIHKIGIIPKCNHQQVPFAYKMYTKADETGWKQSNAFKNAFSIDATIEIVGVWDTVNSVGLIPKTLPFATSNTIVRTFRHAVSLDERRAKFKANLWNRPTTHEASLGTDIQKPQLAHSASNHKLKEHQLEVLYDQDKALATDVLEVWFSGCHCDVGGGSVDNIVTHNLARIPLRWMIRECFKTKTGIMFDSAGLRDIGLDPTRLWPDVLDRPAALPLPQGAKILNIPKSPSTAEASLAKIEAALPNYANADSNAAALLQNATSKHHLTEEEHDILDGLQPVYDQLSLAWFWWILEFWPIKLRYQRGDNTWAKYYGFNLGRARFIPKQKTWGVKVHRSVKMRLEAEMESGGKYKPRAHFDEDCVTWMD